MAQSHPPTEKIEVTLEEKAYLQELLAERKAKAEEKAQAEKVAEQKQKELIELQKKSSLWMALEDKVVGTLVLGGKDEFNRPIKVYPKLTFADRQFLLTEEYCRNLPFPLTIAKVEQAFKDHPGYGIEFMMVKPRGDEAVTPDMQQFAARVGAAQQASLKAIIIKGTRASGTKDSSDRI